MRSRRFALLAACGLLPYALLSLTALTFTSNSAKGPYVAADTSTVSPSAQASVTIVPSLTATIVTSPTVTIVPSSTAIITPSPTISASPTVTPMPCIIYTQSKCSPLSDQSDLTTYPQAAGQPFLIGGQGWARNATISFYLESAPTVIATGLDALMLSLLDSNVCPGIHAAGIVHLSQATTVTSSDTGDFSLNLTLPAALKINIVYILCASESVRNVNSQVQIPLFKISVIPAQQQTNAQPGSGKPGDSQPFSFNLSLLSVLALAFALSALILYVVAPRHPAAKPSRQHSLLNPPERMDTL